MSKPDNNAITQFFSAPTDTWEGEETPPEALDGSAAPNSPDDVAGDAAGAPATGPPEIISPPTTIRAIKGNAAGRVGHIGGRGFVSLSAGRVSGPRSFAWAEDDFIDPESPEQPLPLNARRRKEGTRRALRAWLYQRDEKNRPYTMQDAAKATGISGQSLNSAVMDDGIRDYRDAIRLRGVAVARRTGDAATNLDGGEAGPTLKTLKLKQIQLLSVIEALPAASPRLLGYLKTEKALREGINAIISSIQRANSPASAPALAAKAAPIAMHNVILPPLPAGF